MPKYFIDSHCHFFNIDHIPFYAVLTRLNPIKLTLGALYLSIKKQLKKYEKFITFFEKEISENLTEVIGDINKCGNEFDAEFDTRIKILTPLIMDFEIAVPYEKLFNQVKKLIDEISVAEIDPTYKILPFVGLDLRRFDDLLLSDVSQSVDAFIESYTNNIKSYQERKQHLDLENGDVIGVKLYPPIGFNIFPEDEGIRQKYIEVYKRLNELKIPITVHCQESSYKIIEKKILKKYTKPDNWEKVLNTDGLSDLRVNFAHFGGEDDVKFTLWNGNKFDYNKNKITKGTWTYKIIKLLKKYKNTYSDISAFNFNDKRAVFSFAWLLSMDHAGEFDKLGDYKLEDKLLWGSDNPMTLGDFDGYSSMFNAFLDTIKIGDQKYGMFKTPKNKYGSNIPDDNNLLEKMIDTNPKKFLFDC